MAKGTNDARSLSPVSSPDRPVAGLPVRGRRQVEVPPLGRGGLVVSRTAAAQEMADFGFLRKTYGDSVIPWRDRPDLRTVDDVLAYLARRALPGSEALALKRRMVADLVTRAGAYKHDLLDRVLDESGFWEALERRLAASGKPRPEFLVLIKPNTMMVWARYDEDPANLTDPELVLHLVDRLHERGFARVVVVEAQNNYSHWYCTDDPARGRTVVDVHRWEGIGYPVDEQGDSVDAAGRRDGHFRLVDLTEDAAGHTHAFDEELCFIPRTSLRRYLHGLVPCSKRVRLGEHPLAPTLRDAEFRISFAANKTHTSCYNTLTLKNVYGCLPYANKFLEYHDKREFDWPTIVLLRAFPFHFGIIDAIFSADGVLGFKADCFPRMTRTIIAGEDLVAVDVVGSLKMGLDPLRSRLIWLGAQVFGYPVDRIEWRADGKEPYPGWINVPRRYDWVQYWGENWYWVSRYLGQATSEMDPYFQPRPAATEEAARPAQRLYKALIRPALNITEGFGRKPLWRWLWRSIDRPAALRRRYPGLYA